MDEGFNGYGERIDFKEHDANFKHTFFVDVPRTGSDFPMLVDVYMNGVLVESVEGTTEGVTLSMPVLSVPLVEDTLDTRASFSTTLDGIDYEMVITADQSYVSQVNGDLTIEVHSPDGTSQKQIGNQAGFNGYGQRVDLKIDNNLDTHKFFARVQRSGSDFPITIDLYKDGQLVTSASGTTNGIWINAPMN